MSSLPILMPKSQNWSCHNCAGCCSQHLIEVTEAERQRILDQHWTADDGVTQDPLVKLPGSKSAPQYRLAHQPDGRCVFLDDRGLCRIHAKFGEPAKPLACRVYPYALHPHGNAVTVSLRFSCPSVVANLGEPVAQQKAELRAIADAVVPAGAELIPPPEIRRGLRTDWPTFLAINRHLLKIMTDEQTDPLLRVYRGLALVEQIEHVSVSDFETIGVDGLLNLMLGVITTDTPHFDRFAPPSTTGRLFFRLCAANYARKDTVQTLAGGWRQRWRLLTAILRFTRGRGLVPPLQPGFNPVPFAALEEPFGGLPAGTEELLTRYWQVKLAGLHYCGPAYYQIPMDEGFRSLMLVLPVLLWLARWCAASESRTTLTLDDVRFALAAVDHHHGYAAFLGQASTRSRTRQLATTGDLFRLCLWYAR